MRILLILCVFITPNLFAELPIQYEKTGGLIYDDKENFISIMPNGFVNINNNLFEVCNEGIPKRVSNEVGFIRCYGNYIKASIEAGIEINAYDGFATAKDHFGNTYRLKAPKGYKLYRKAPVVVKKQPTKEEPKKATLPGGYRQIVPSKNKSAQ